MKLSIVLTVLLSLTGCVTADQYTQHLKKQFVGKTMDTAIAEYGPPSASANYGDGKIHEWTRSMGHRGLSSTEVGGAAASETQKRFCTWRVTADKKGVITHAGWTGNACYNQLMPLPKN